MTDFRPLADALRGEIAKPLREDTMGNKHVGSRFELAEFADTAVERVATVIRRELMVAYRWGHTTAISTALSTPEQVVDSGTEEVMAAIDRLLAERDIDTLLESVGASGEFFNLASGKWCVPLWTASEITDKSIGTYGAHERNDIAGTGDTFTEALRNAVAKAKETHDAD